MSRQPTPYSGVEQARSATYSVNSDFFVEGFTSNGLIARRTKLRRKIKAIFRLFSPSFSLLSHRDFLLFLVFGFHFVLVAVARDSILKRLCLLSRHTFVPVHLF